MSVILRKRKNADGSTTLQLDIYRNGQRTVETLKHLKLSKPPNLFDREQNKKRLHQAEEIAVSRAAELEANNYNMVTDAGKKRSLPYGCKTLWRHSSLKHTHRYVDAANEMKEKATYTLNFNV